MHDTVEKKKNVVFTDAADILMTGLTEAAGGIEEELDNALAKLAKTVCNISMSRPPNSVQGPFRPRRTCATSGRALPKAKSRSRLVNRFSVRSMTLRTTTTIGSRRESSVTSAWHDTHLRQLAQHPDSVRMRILLACPGLIVDFYGSTIQDGS